jgi:acyl CoA:acetate/3-ketoacid CoA transferase beta subunit
VSECALAATGLGVMSRVYTELGVYSMKEGSLELTELVPRVWRAPAAPQ